MAGRGEFNDACVSSVLTFEENPTELSDKSISLGGSPVLELLLGIFPAAVALGCLFVFAIARKLCMRLSARKLLSIVEDLLVRKILAADISIL